MLPEREIKKGDRLALMLNGFDNHAFVHIKTGRFDMNAFKQDRPIFNRLEVTLWLVVL